jgi:hypothetical protein
MRTLGLGSLGWSLLLAGCGGDGPAANESTGAETSGPGTGMDSSSADPSAGSSGPGGETGTEGPGSSSGPADDSSGDSSSSGGSPACGQRGGSDPGPFAPNPDLDPLADNTALDLGAYECASRMPQIADHCELITDYSRLNYDPYVHRILMFGGGHAATGRTDVDVLDFSTLSWSSLYPSMSCDEVALGDLDGLGFHNATGHPVARHTYDQSVVVDDGGAGRLLLLSTEGFAGYCHQYDASIRAVAALPLDPACTQWQHGGQFDFPWSYAAAAEFDPVSGMVIMVGQTTNAGEGGMWVFDPTTEEIVAYVDAVEYEGIAGNLVYFPPNERMYLFMVDGGVRELVLDRANWGASTSALLAADGPAPPNGETGYAYDSRNQVIGGAVADGTFHVFDPTTQTWCAEPMLAASKEQAQVGTVAFHALDYDPVDNVYVFLADGPSGRRTWAYRWRG